MKTSILSFRAWFYASVLCSAGILAGCQQESAKTGMPANEIVEPSAEGLELFDLTGLAVGKNSQPAENSGLIESHEGYFTVVIDGNQPAVGPEASFSLESNKTYEVTIDYEAVSLVSQAPIDFTAWSFDGSGNATSQHSYAVRLKNVDFKSSKRQVVKALFSRNANGNPAIIEFADKDVVAFARFTVNPGRKSTGSKYKIFDISVDVVEN